MEKVFVVIFISIVEIHSRSTSQVGRSIYLIHTVSRHGDRTPVDTYPTDPHINASFAPYGWAQLTKMGRHNQYELGKFLKKRYKKFLGKECSTQNSLKIQSTDCARTKISARLQIEGLLANSSESIPVLYEPLNEDKLLLVRTPCPRYFQLQHSAVKLMEEQHSLIPLYEYLTAKTKNKIQTPDDIQSLYSTLKAEEDFGLQLPRWTRRVYPTSLYEVAVLSFLINAFDEEMQKLKAGQFLSHLINHYMEKANGMKKYEIKAFLYVGHDSTIANLLIALGVWQGHIPPYNSMIIFELHELSNDFAVQILYKNSTAANSVHHLVLPHCEKLCPLRKFMDLTKKVRCSNLKLECVSDKWTLQVAETRKP